MLCWGLMQAGRECTSQRNIKPVYYNGKSLSWMGITRERWCRTRGLVSGLDMNTCQTSIKTRYINIALLKTPPRYYRQYKRHTVVPTELNKRVT